MSSLVPRSLSRRFSFGSFDAGVYETSIKLWPPPLMMLSFSVIQFVIHIVRYLFDYLIDFNFNYCTQILICSSIDENKDIMPEKFASNYLTYKSCQRSEIWRFLSYMLVHRSYTHLISNLALQIVLGVVLEAAHGWWRVLIVYLSGVLAGSLGHSFVTPCGTLKGVSAGCFCLLFAHIANIIINWHDMEFGMAQLFVILLYGMFDLSLAYIKNDQSKYFLFNF